MSKPVVLASESVEAIARRVVEMQREIVVPADSDPWLTRAQAERYLNVSRTVFFEMRQTHPGSLKPVSERPLRWSRNALDLFKLTRGVPLPARRGRKPQRSLAA